MGTTGREHEDKKHAEEGTGSWERQLLPEGHSPEAARRPAKAWRTQCAGRSRSKPRCGCGEPLPPAAPLHWLTGGVYSIEIENHSGHLRGAERSLSSLAWPGDARGAARGHPRWADPAGKHCTGRSPVSASRSAPSVSAPQVPTLPAF